MRAAKAVVIAAGGIGGNLELVRREWPTAELGSPPEKLLMGSHYYADGALHEEVRRVGGNVTHLSRMWNYADAVRHPKPQREHHGLKLIPPRSGVMLDPDGRRYGPVPVMPTFDAYAALERMCEDERKYSWLICNFKIAKRELDVSGSQHNPHLRERRLLPFLLGVLLGKPGLVSHFLEGSPDFVSASSLRRAGQQMNEVTGETAIDAAVLEREIGRYDDTIARGKGLFNDDQLRRIAQLRNWRGDRLRTARFQRIVDPKAGPLIAIRLQVMARKSLGGIQTDLGCRVLRAADGEPIPGLYAVGEAAGFGGGGVHGKRSLEGTFLGGCVFTGRLAAAAIAGSRAAAAHPSARGDSPPTPTPSAPPRTEGAARFDYVTVGHVTLDVLRLVGRRRRRAPTRGRRQRQPGGGAFYSALQAARLGLRTLILTQGVPREIEALLEPYRDRARRARDRRPQHTTTLRTAGSGASRSQRVLAWAGPIVEPPEARQPRSCTSRRSPARRP